MKILTIEPFGFQGHQNFNTFFLRCLREIGHVTFVAPSGYLECCSVDSRIDIPSPLLRQKTKFGARCSGIRVLNYILKRIRLDDYDAIVFLAYETISFSLRWPKSRKVFLFEHNNIESTLGSWVKTFCYRHLPSSAVHLAFQHHVAKHIQDTCGRDVVCVPHPHYRKDVDGLGVIFDTATSHRPGGPTIIFSPSGSTPEAIQGELKTLVSKANGAYYLICKGGIAQKTDHWEVSPFFECYEEHMRSCDLVFLGARFDYRASGVAYEALSYGKPILHLDCVFARELHANYPNLVFPFNEVNDILSIEIDQEKARNDHARFLRKHSIDTIRADMVRAFGATEPIILL